MNGILVQYNDAAGVLHVTKGRSLSFVKDRALLLGEHNDIILSIPANRIRRVLGCEYTNDELGSRVRLANSSEGGGK